MNHITKLEAQGKFVKAEKLRIKAVDPSQLREFAPDEDALRGEDFEKATKAAVVDATTLIMKKLYKYLDKKKITMGAKMRLQDKIYDDVINWIGI